MRETVPERGRPNEEAFNEKDSCRLAAKGFCKAGAGSRAGAEAHRFGNNRCWHRLITEFHHPIGRDEVAVALQAAQWPERELPMG